MNLIDEVTSDRGSLERIGMARAKGKHIPLKKDRIYMVIDVTDMSFAEQISKARELQGMSNKDTAELLEISTGYISKIQSEAVDIAPQQRYKMLAYCNFDHVPSKE